MHANDIAGRLLRSWTNENLHAGKFIGLVNQDDDDVLASLLLAMTRAANLSIHSAWLCKTVQSVSRLLISICSFAVFSSSIVSVSKGIFWSTTVGQDKLLLSPFVRQVQLWNEVSRTSWQVFCTLTSSNISKLHKSTSFCTLHTLAHLLVFTDCGCHHPHSGHYFTDSFDKHFQCTAGWK